MFSFYLAASDTAMTLGEKLSLGGQVSLLGMGTVFAVLAILWGLVELMHLLLTGVTGGKKKNAVPAKAEAPAPAPAPAPAAAAAADDLEIVAVITAAIAAASGSSPSSFRVVSFKRANDRFSSGK